MTSLQKRTKYFIDNNQKVHSSPYIRVRMISRNKSAKNISLKSKEDINIVCQKQNTKNKGQTSFFLKQNCQQFHKNSNKNPFFNPIDNVIIKPSIRKNNSLKLLTKFKSHQILPLNGQQKVNVITSQINNAFFNGISQGQKVRPVSLKRKINLFRKEYEHNQMQNLHKNQFEKVISQVKIKSQNLLGLGNNKRPKLKLMVRNPFEKHIKRQELIVGESTIQHVQDQSLISQDNRQQFEQFLNCIG